MTIREPEKKKKTQDGMLTKTLAVSFVLDTGFEVVGQNIGYFLKSGLNLRREKYWK